MLSVILGIDVSWDMANYHYYNPYAFFHNRDNLDYWPASYIHVYFNPIADFFSYFLINSFPPKLTVFLSGAIQGINFWLFFQIINRVIPPRYYSNLIGYSLLLVGICHPVGINDFGNFKNDYLICILIFGYMLLQIQFLNAYEKFHTFSYSLLAFSGVFLGIAVGLKLTAMTFLLGAFLGILIAPILFLDKIKMLFVLGVASGCGFLLVSAYWMWHLWSQYHNPFFPFFNVIFKSPDYLPINIAADTRVIPKGLLANILYPFTFSLSGSGDGRFRDLRFLLAYSFFIIYGLAILYKKILKKPTYTFSLAVLWMFWFYIFSYIFNQWSFSLLRYMPTLQILSPLIIYLLLIGLFPEDRKLQKIVGVILIGTLLLFIKPVNKIGRIADYNASFFDVKIPQKIRNQPEALVLLAYPAYALNLEPRPQAYLIPFFPSQWRFVGVPFALGKFSPELQTQENIKRLAQSYPKKIYVLTTDVMINELIKVAENFGLKTDGECEKITSLRQRISSKNVLLCPVKKI